MLGDLGNDILFGGGGEDILIGGEGEDIFVLFGELGSIDIINDFNFLEDFLVLSGNLIFEDLSF